MLTGICLLHGNQTITDCETTRVSFIELDEKEIDEYVASGEPMDKAGAYGIQGLASKFVDRIDGDFFNVMALPLALAWRTPEGAYQTSTLDTVPSVSFTRPIDASFS